MIKKQNLFLQFLQTDELSEVRCSSVRFLIIALLLPDVGGIARASKPVKNVKIVE